MTTTRFLVGQILVVFAILIGGLWLSTEWVAAALGYQRRLDLPWFEGLSLPVYYPRRLFEWWYAFDAHAPTLFNTAGIMAMWSGVAGIVVGVIGSLWRALQSRLATTYGSSHWASRSELEAAGHHLTAGWRARRLQWNDAGHRLAPWLSHGTVSNQETARPPLTPGEVMQLPPATSWSWSGPAPIRAKKLRYHEDLTSPPRYCLCRNRQRPGVSTGPCHDRTIGPDRFAASIPASSSHRVRTEPMRAMMKKADGSAKSPGIERPLHDRDRAAPYRGRTDVRNRATISTTVYPLKAHAFGDR